MSNQFIECSGSFQNTDFKWTHSANWLLINSFLEFKQEFADPERRKDIWMRIAEKFNENGYEVSYELLDKKFRNLKATYYQVRERKRHSVNKQIKWEYYKVFEELFEEEEEAAAVEETVEALHEDPRLASFRSSVYVPVENRKRKRTPSKSQPLRETTKIVNIEPVIDGLDDDTMDDSKPIMNGDHRIKVDIAPIDDTIIEESQESTYEDDDEDYEEDASANYDIPSVNKKSNLASLEAKKLQAETRYFHKKADYFEKQTTILDIQKKLMVLQAHKLKLEIDRMKIDRKCEQFNT